MEPLQSKIDRSNQLSDTSGWEAGACGPKSNPTKWEAQAGRADLRMCLMRPELVGDQAEKPRESLETFIIFIVIIMFIFIIFY